MNIGQQNLSKGGDLEKLHAKLLLRNEKGKWGYESATEQNCLGIIAIIKVVTNDTMMR
mgnify:CR=1 FL=1